MRERRRPGKKAWLCHKQRTLHRQFNEKPLSRGEARERRLPPGTSYPPG